MAFEELSVEKSQTTEKIRIRLEKPQLSANEDKETTVEGEEEEHNEKEDSAEKAEGFADAFAADNVSMPAASLSGDHSQKQNVRLSINFAAAQKTFDDANRRLPPHRAKMRKSLLDTIRAVKESEVAADSMGTVALYDFVESLEAALKKLPADKILKQFRSIEFNLKDAKNNKLRRGVLRREIAPEALTSMSQTDLANPEIQASRKHALEEKIERADTKNHKVEVKTGFFACRRCGKRETTFHEMQTARGDEASTKFVSCLNCGLHWKFR